MNKGIYKDKECSDLVLKGVNQIADLVTKTMGPYGKTIILTDLQGNSKITKDGYSVVKEIEFTDPIMNSAATLLKQVTKKTVEEAGDSTTTAICLARAIIARGFHLMNKDKIPFVELKKELDLFEKNVYYTLDKSKRRLLKAEIIDVATISANGDKEIAELITKAYNKAELVKVEESGEETNDLTIINGMELDTGLFDKAFINTPEKQSIEYTKPALLLIDGHLTELKNIAHLVDKYKEGIIIVADHFSQQILSIFRELFNKGKLNIGLVKSPGFATHRKDLMKDLALFTSSKLINCNNKTTEVGLSTVDSVKITQNKFIVTKQHLDPEVKKYTNELKASIKEVEGVTKDLIKKRIENLTGSLAVIKVGGVSEVEMEEKKDRVDDAVLAVKCALEEGVIEGGGKLLYLNYSSIGTLFGSCLKAPFNTIRKNGAVLDLKDDFFKLGIIDPVKATRIAFRNALSVAKTILSTEGAVITERVWI